MTLVTVSDRNGNSGIFARARSYARDVANPFQSGVHSLLQPVGNFLYGALNYQALEKQNQLLRQQVADDQAAAVQAMGEQAQAAQVLAQEDLPYLAAIPSVAAQVVDLGAANFEQTIELDRVRPTVFRSANPWFRPEGSSAASRPSPPTWPP